jgi:hypothetical protein
LEHTAPYQVGRRIGFRIIPDTKFQPVRPGRQRCAQVVRETALIVNDRRSRGGENGRRKEKRRKYEEKGEGTSEVAGVEPGPPGGACDGLAAGV